MRSKYSGYCRACGDKIRIGEEIVKQDYSTHWVHEVCPDSIPDKLPPVCDKCHMTKPCDCE